MTMHGAYDGGDSHATANISAFWDVVSLTTNLSISAGTGRRGTNSLRLASTTGRLLTRHFPTPQEDFWVAGAVRYDVPLGSNQDLFNLVDAAGNNQIQVRATPAGGLLVYRGPATALLVTSSIGLTIGAYTFVELKGIIHNTAGSVEIRVNGVSGGSASNVDTQQSSTFTTVSAVQFGLAGLTSSAPCDLDDLVWGDLQGAVDNDFPGDVAVVSTLPNGAGTSTQLTPSAGANYAAVDDATPNTTDYISSGTDGHKDTYAFADIPGTGTVKKVFAMPYARKSDVGDAKSLIVRARHSGVEAASDPVALGTDWRYWGQKGFETNPSTTNPWTLAEVNAAEFGVEVEV